MVQANDLRKGMAIIFRNELYEVLEYEHIAPGNWRAMVQTTLRNMKTGKSTNNRFRSNEEVEVAWMDKCKMQFLYQDQTGAYFMNLENFETVEISVEKLGDSMNFLIENMEIDVSFYQSEPMRIELPTTVTLEVIEAEPGEKGNTVNNLKKNAKVETGYELSVPLFIDTGEKIIIDTRTGEYISRA